MSASHVALFEPVSEPKRLWGRMPRWLVDEIRTLRGLAAAAPPNEKRVWLERTYALFLKIGVDEYLEIHFCSIATRYYGLEIKCRRARLLIELIAPDGMSARMRIKYSGAMERAGATGTHPAGLFELISAYGGLNKLLAAVRMSIH